MQKYTRYKQFIPQRLYHLMHIVASYRTSGWDDLTKKFEVSKLDDDELLSAAKQLHAQVYLERRFIAEDDVQDSIINKQIDPYQDHADYFGVIDTTNSSVVAVARQIRTDENIPLPIFKHVSLSKDYSLIAPQQIVEISAFVKRRGIDSRALLLLFHEMFSHSKTNHHRFWLMAMDKEVYRRMKTLFGPVLRRIGPATYYMGSDVVPVEVDVDMAEQSLRRGYLVSLPPLRGVRRFVHSSLKTDGPKNVTKTAFWNAYAKAYDGLLEFVPYKHLIDHISEIVLSYRPRKVLDLGCGTGNVTAKLVDKDPQLHVDAVDWSRVMLDMLPPKVRGKSVVISRRDALQFLETCRRRYDVIVMSNVLYAISDRKRLWKLLQKCLADDGRIVVANPDTGDSRSLIKNHIDNDSAITLLRPSLLAVWVFDGLISLGGSNEQYQFVSKDELLAEIDEAGLCVDGEVGRCYGGHAGGIDLLFSVKKRTKAS